MKNLIYVIVVFGLFFKVHAQEVKSEKKSKSIFFGVKAGVNAVKTNENKDNPLSFGYQIGTTLNIPISKRFSFQPEILYQQINTNQKTVIEYFNGTRTKEVTTKNSLLLVPLNFQYAISKKVNIDLGPTVGYAINVEKTDKVIENINGVETIYNFDPNYNFGYKSKSNKIALGFNLGTNYNFTETIYAGFRYTLFISDFQTLDSTIENSLFALSMGYNFK